MTYLEDEKIAEKRRAGNLLVNTTVEKLRQHFMQHPIRITDVVPDDELWLVQDGKLVGKIVNLKTGCD